MDTFNVKRRDVYSFDSWMDVKQPGFGGPASAEPLRDNKGKVINTDRKLEGYQNTVKRHDAFKNQVFNSTYKAMGGDLVHKQEFGKNPYDYPDLHNNMGIATVNVGNVTNEGKCYDYLTFVLESEDLELDKCEECEECEDCDDNKDKKKKRH